MICFGIFVLIKEHIISLSLWSHVCVTPYGAYNRLLFSGQEDYIYVVLAVHHLQKLVALDLHFACLVHKA